jgi:hypothetical protein
MEERLRRAAVAWSASNQRRETMLRTASAMPMIAVKDPDGNILSLIEGGE